MRLTLPYSLTRSANRPFETSEATARPGVIDIISVTDKRRCYTHIGPARHSWVIAMNITDKTALITGAGSGIGRATAIAMAERGVRLALAGRRRESLDETLRMTNAAGGDAIIIPGDVTDRQWRDEAIDTVCARFGGPDIIVNCAQVIIACGLDDVNDDDIRRQVEVNLLAPILLTRAALPALRQSPAAAVVDVSSSIGLVGLPFYSIYAATKGGLARFDESLRRELAVDGIHVMTVYPVSTDMPLMKSAGDGGDCETPEALAAAMLQGLANDETDVVRGSDDFACLIGLNQSDPQAADRQLSLSCEYLHKRANMQPLTRRQLLI